MILHALSHTHTKSAHSAVLSLSCSVGGRFVLYLFIMEGEIEKLTNCVLRALHGTYACVFVCVSGGLQRLRRKMIIDKENKHE